MQKTLNIIKLDDCYMVACNVSLIYIKYFHNVLLLLRNYNQMQLICVAKTSVRHSLYLIDKIYQGSISGFDIDEFCDLMLSEMEVIR